MTENCKIEQYLEVQNAFELSGKRKHRGLTALSLPNHSIGSFSYVTQIRIARSYIESLPSNNFRRRRCRHVCEQLPFRLLHRIEADAPCRICSLENPSQHAVRAMHIDRLATCAKRSPTSRSPLKQTQAQLSRLSTEVLVGRVCNFSRQIFIFSSSETFENDELTSPKPPRLV